MTVLIGTILSGGVPLTGTLYLRLSANAKLNGGTCGSGAIAADPPYIFNMAAGVLSGPGPGAYTVPGADCLTPAGLTYHLTATSQGGQIVLEKDVTITGAKVDIGNL